MPASQDVKISPEHVAEVLERLQEKKIQVQRELAKIPSAPSNRDVFQLCRGFERAFSYTIEKTDYASVIRRTFDDEGLAGAVSRMPLERKFKLDAVKEVVRVSDGFQPHLVSPELGLRRLVQESIDLVMDPVTTSVRRIHQVLLDVARQASVKASLLLDTTVLDESRTPLRLPQFERVVMLAATKALELWRDEALEVARTIVAMEKEYVTAAFFRHRMYERYRQWEQEYQLQNMLDEGHAVPDESDSEDDSETSPSHRRNGDDSSDGGMAIPDAVESPKKERERERPKEERGPEFGGDLKTGYMEKRIGEHSTRQSLPESWKWQKRYWVLSEPKGLLYYFKSADDPPTYRGIINIRECRVEDVDANGMPKTNNARSKYDLDGGGGTVSLLIKVSHKDPSKAAIKKHHSLVLRCETASEKYAWLARLKHVSETAGVDKPVRKYTTAQLQAESSRAAERDSGKRVDRSDRNASKPPPQKTPSTPHIHAAMGGIGSTVLFQDDSKIGPEPINYGLADDDGTDSYDRFLRQMGEDTAAYVRTVCNTIVLTVPKAIVHCQVKRAEKQMLEELYAHMSSLQTLDKESLMSEEPEIMQRRAAIKQSILDLDDGIKRIKEHAEQQGPEADYWMPSDLLERAGMGNLAPTHVRENSGTLYGDYTPNAFKESSPRGSYMNGGSREGYAGSREGYAGSRGGYAERLPPVANPDRLPPVSRTVSSASSQAPRRSSNPNIITGMPRVTIPTTPTGPPNLSSPSPLPRRRPPPPP